MSIAIGKRILQARKAAGLSLRQLANKTEESHTTIAKYEKGVKIPNSTMLIILAKALDVRVEYFFRQNKVEVEITHINLISCRSGSKGSCR